MRKTVLTAAAALTVGAIAAGSIMAAAQPASPAPGDGMSGPPHHEMMRGHHEGRRRPFRMGTFALVYRQEDLKLSPADVQKIAEAFLLRRGNHTWKVTEVAPTPDGDVAFAVTTPEGSIIARFTMDPHTGEVTRTG
jgi:L-aminopeptidase/D-esterase-like protein